MGKDKPQPRERVIFRPPIGMKKANRMSGKIVDWTPWRLFSGKWGQYLFQAQLIMWDEGWKGVRIVYYRRNTSRGRWQFASQTTVHSTAQIIKTICRDILKTTW